MLLRRTNLIAAGMLIPAAHAQAPQSAPELPASKVIHIAADGASDFPDRNPRLTAEALRGDAAIRPIFASEQPR